MRIFPVKFRSSGRLSVCLAGLALLMVLLTPVSVFARTTQAALHRERRIRRLHTAAHRTHRRRVPARASYRRTSLRRQPVKSRSAHLRRVSRYGRRARARRYRVEADLDNIRTHTPPVDTPTVQTEAAASAASDLESTRPAALISPAAVSPAGANGSQGDVPFLETPVPSYMPAALRGSRENLIHQNIIADVEGLSRIQNDAQLRVMVRSGDLVALPASSRLVIDQRLPMNRRYCRPWTAKFLSDLSRAHATAFDDPLILTSAVRTVEFQRHLAHYNGNAAPTAGDTASPHLTGQAIDLGKKGMSLHEIAWMRTVLGQLQAAGKLDVEEEFEQACFHISVYKTYAPHSSLPETLVASNESAPAELAPPPTAAVGGLDRAATVRTVSYPVARRSWTAHSRRYSGHAARRAALLRRRRRRHHAAMSLLAARMR